MPAATPPSRFWIHWLSAASAGVVFFGLVLVLAPGLARQGFAWLVYAAPARIDGFGAEAVHYIGLGHAVIGAVMVGWGVAMWLVARRLLARGLRIGWTLLALPLAAWFVPDTAYSLASGDWPNALLNSVFAVMFAVPLWATRGVAGELAAA